MEKKNNLGTISHVIVMGIMCVLSVISACIIFSGHIPEGYEIVTGAQKTASYISGIGHTLNVLALICGMIYVLKGSGKDVAGLYKTYLLLVALGLAARFAGKLINSGFGVPVCLMLGSIIMLLILTFAKDMGKTKTWTVFCILFVLDLIVSILAFESREALSSIASGLTRLVLDLTIATAIYSKYKDKAARGK